jgi:hypothetical protein
VLRIIAAVALGAWALTSVAADADDWTAEQLRGQVLQLIGDHWQPLGRGMVVPDSRVIRTLWNGRVTFVRGNEAVDIGPGTEIQIFDKGGRRPFTTVKQYFGSVSVEAQVEEVQHFAVQTPYLAAVVKGTRFTVTSGERGASVSVQRGHVLVEDKENKTQVTLSVGQSASVGSDGAGELEVAGTGKLPTVLGADGKPADTALTPKQIKAAEKDARKAAEEAKKAAEKAAKDAGKNDNKGPGGSGNSESAGSGKGKGKD